MDKKQPQDPTSDTDRNEARPEQAGNEPERPREIGGRDGPEPTRYGDWEKAGRCVDF
jgi:hypothetical protein